MQTRIKRGAEGPGGRGLRDMKRDQNRTYNRPQNGRTEIETEADRDRDSDSDRERNGNSGQVNKQK